MSRIVVVGGGPAGLFAAERLSAAGHKVVVHDRMPSLGRKFLMAGRGGLNLTHAEDWSRFVERYGAASAALRPALDAFTSTDLRAWADSLGQETFVGPSDRVFPVAMKASPLLRAWIGRLVGQGVEFRLRSRFTGWTSDGAISFQSVDGDTTADRPDAVVLACGGGSWARLGSDGAALDLLAERSVGVTAFRPSNVGANIDWTPSFAERFAGEPLKACAFTVGRNRVRGEAVITRYGLEGGAIYALSPHIRSSLDEKGSAVVWIDLRPDLTADQISDRIVATPAHQSMSNRLRKALKLSPQALSVLREANPILPATGPAIAQRIKGVALAITGLQPIDRAISSAGGVRFDALDERLMVKALPGVFCAGEMLDWEAPTGGYLLQGCMATGAAAADGVMSWLAAA